MDAPKPPVPTSQRPCAPRCGTKAPCRWGALRRSQGLGGFWDRTLPIASLPCPSFSGAAGGRWMEVSMVGTEHLTVMDLHPNHRLPGSRGVVSRGEGSARQGRWVIKGQAWGISSGAQGLAWLRSPLIYHICSFIHSFILYLQGTTPRTGHWRVQEQWALLVL